MKAEQIDDSKLTWHLVDESLPKKEGTYRVAMYDPVLGYKRANRYWDGYWAGVEYVLAWGAEAVQGELPLK